VPSVRRDGGRGRGARAYEPLPHSGVRLFYLMGKSMRSIMESFDVMKLGNLLTYGGFQFQSPIVEPCHKPTEFGRRPFRVSELLI
jgi:hypothetical protein